MRLLIDGYHVETWNQANISMRMLTHGLLEAFRRLPVEIETVCCWDRHNVPLPQVDAVVVIDFYTLQIQDDLKTGWLKQQTGAKKIVAVCEGPFEHADCSVFFDDSIAPAAQQDSMLVPLPYMPQFLQPTVKLPRTVLFDYKTNFEHDWTDRILEWSQELPDYQFARICDVGQEEYCSSVERIERLPYPLYLDATAHFERFVPTHGESYGFSVVDMAARGTEVIAPVNYLRPGVVRDLKIKEFSSKEEMLHLLQQPYELPPMPPDGYTTYDAMAQMILTYLE